MTVARHRRRLGAYTIFLVASLYGYLPAAFAAPAAEPPTRGPFVDVPRDHWAYEAVEELRQRGILLGYPPAPERPATAPAPARGQARPAPPSPARRRGSPGRLQRPRLNEHGRS